MLSPKMDFPDHLKLELKLALKISLIALLIVFLGICWIIYFNGIYIQKSEKEKFLQEISTLRDSLKKEIDISEYNANDYTTSFDDFEVADRLLRDTVIIKENGTIYKKGLYETLTVDPATMPDAYSITSAQIWGRNYLLFKAEVSKDWVLFTRDITFIRDYQNNLIFIGIIFWSILFIVTLISSYILARISLYPVRETNSKLREYNYHVAHELKTPLSVIKWMIDVTKMSGDIHELDGSEEEVKGLEKIINSLLFLWENTIIKEKNTFPLIDEINKSIHSFKAQKTFIIKKNAMWVKLHTHKALFERLLKNLIENAIKYASADEITITIDKWYFEVQNEIDFEVDDAKLNRVFEPFYKLDASRTTTGYGLWLSIVKRIVEMFWWKVQAISSKNTFTMRVYFS